MKRTLKNIRVFILVLVVFFLIPVLSWSAKSDSVKDINNLLKEEKVQLEQLKKKIAKREKQLKSIGKKETSVLKTLGQLEDRLKLRERELRIYHWNIKINKKQMGSLETKILKMEEQLKRQQYVLGMRLRALYKEGGMVPVKILFSSEGMAELLQRFKYMDSIMAYDTAVFRTFESRLKQLQGEKQTLLKVKANLLTLEKAALSKKDDLEKEKSGRSNFLKKISGEKKYALKAREELVASSGELNNLIARLQEKLVLGKGLSILDKKGKLRYPVPGTVLNKFGKHRDRKYGTFIVNNGIDLKVPGGTPVRAVFDGKVLFTGKLEGYGNLVILGHGEKYHSLYGHMEMINVKTGEIVGEGGILGTSGDTGSLIGPTLYLEMRHQGKPIEPTRWFKVVKR